MNWKKFFFVTGIIGLFCVTYATPTFAAMEPEDFTVTNFSENTPENYKSENDSTADSLTEIEPIANNPLLRGATIPTAKHNVWKADYSFNGGSHSAPLYSSKRLYGKGDRYGNYNVTVTNTSKVSVHVMCKHEKKTYLIFDVPAGRTITKSFKNIYPSTEWYLRFSAGTGQTFAVRGTVK